MCVTRIWRSIMGQILGKWQADFGNRTCLDTVYYPHGILDLQFTPVKTGVFAIATSKGAVCVYTVGTGATGPLEQINSFQVFSNSLLTLSLAWNHALSHSDAIAASSSDGEIAIFDIKYEPPMTCTKTQAHCFEAWTVAWKYEGAGDGLILELYSGGDDSVLSKHDLSVCRVSGSLDDGNIPSHGYYFMGSIDDTNIHRAGVTAILPLPSVFHTATVLLTGSYDEYVRVLLPTKGGNGLPEILAELKIGGGVWRLKMLDFSAPDHDDIGM